MNDIRDTINIIDEANQIKTSIVQKISESTVDDMADLMEHMSDEDIDGIVMMIDVSKSSLTEGDFADNAKEIWGGAMAKAKKVFGGGKLAKLKGLMSRLSDKRMIMKGWEAYKARYKIEVDSMEDFVRYIKQDFPSLSGNTIVAATKEAPFKFDSEGNITNLDAFIIALSRNAEEALQAQISDTTGTVDNGSGEKEKAGGEPKAGKNTKSNGGSSSTGGSTSSDMGQLSKKTKNNFIKTVGDETRYNTAIKELDAVSGPRGALQVRGDALKLLIIAGFSAING